jgi:hypothetical protein
VVRRLFLALLTLGPLAVVLDYASATGDLTLFSLAADALIPLAWLIGEATGQAARYSTVANPIVVEGDLWGTVLVGSTVEPLPLDTEQPLEKFTELVATAIANTQSRRS